VGLFSCHPVPLPPGDGVSGEWRHIKAVSGRHAPLFPGGQAPGGPGGAEDLLKHDLIWSRTTSP
jgi:hypothetical protein